MNGAQQRITLLLLDDTGPVTDWSRMRSRHRRIVFVNSFDALTRAIEYAACDDSPVDVERVVIDRAASAQEFLDFLSTLPPRFLGDIVRVGEHRGGFLSAATRGEGRVLHRLSRADLRFYLETNQLLSARTPAATTAVEERP